MTLLRRAGAILLRLLDHRRLRAWPAMRDRDEAFREAIDDLGERHPHGDVHYLREKRDRRKRRQT